MIMRPVLVTPPQGSIVTLEELRLQCRADEVQEEDALLLSLRDAAMAHLDGWYGILGRCILSQTWQQDFATVGPVRLALPDITDLEVVRVDAEGAEIEVLGSVIRHDALGTTVSPRVLAPGPLRVRFTAEMPRELRPVVAQAVKMLVGHWYANREAVVTGTIATALPFAVNALLGPIRAVRV
ncbi:head-tail connector protein [Falsirhodobacter halotolerans]|uniref:head-tail connector protein n=1 Tax=Falsirhodobacter halotolerans TaxID=1146892 RepID=UPI001FD2F5F0|nr:head-tail connector protein [Falsirhodobacter halotolerans]MCJ8139569.1 head-tail connector protein [Falsirhodobacter halotolerans]